MKKIIILFIIIQLISCSTDEKRNYKLIEFKNSKNINGEHIGPKNIFLKPYQLTISDSIWVILDNATDKHIHLLDKQKLIILHSFGKTGKGPKEFIYPEISKRINNMQLLINNKGKFYSSLFNLDSLMLQKNYFPSQKIIYPPKVIIPYNLLYINDTTIIGSTSSGNSRLFKFNPNSENVYFEKNNISFKGKNISHTADLGQIYYSISDYNEKRGKIINVMRFFDRIDILNTDLEIDKTLIKKHSESENYKLKSEGEIINDETMFYYLDVFTNNKYIFALYCGKNFKEATPNVGNEIHVFNWDGEGIYVLYINIGISNIVISKDNMNLYGFDIYSNQPIVKYDLSFLKNP